MFDMLDTLAGLSLRLQFDDMTRLTHAKKTLAELEDSLPAGVGSVLLPRARAAVIALEDVQAGFFLKPRLSAAGLRRPDKRGNDEVIPLDRAVSEYLRCLRNAGHGFGATDRNGAKRSDVLLTSHNGELPFDLSDLGWLYLLRLMSQPQLLRRR
jgi:hypothetical protein